MSVVGAACRRVHSLLVVWASAFGHVIDKTSVDLWKEQLRTEIVSGSMD